MDTLDIFGIDAAPALHRTVENLAMAINPTQRMYVLYLLTSFLLAFMVWIARKQKGGARGFLKWLFHPDIYGHKSAKQDYWFFIVNALVFYGLAAPLVVSAKPLAAWVNAGLTSWLGAPEAPLLSSTAAVVLFTACYALLFDFALFITHYLQHKVPWLWSFHRVHHSAEVLTPITVLRMHPLDLLYASAAVSVLTGVGYGLFTWLVKGPIEGTTVLGLNIIMFLFFVTGYHLRHSHVWLSYPVWLSHIFVSPAQHQIHHSTARQHMDKNMGFTFAFWDRAFGTLYVPREREEISYGIGKKEPNPFNSVTDMFLEPFRHAWRALAEGYARQGVDGLLRVVTLWGMVTVIFAFLYGGAVMPYERMLAPPPSVHLEDLTWTEVRRALDRGYDTVIIPTGGTEQNGPHVVLGKHNFIVHRTSGDIARRLGNALVAPVLSYVPEDMHIKYPGTVDISSSVFEDVLTDAADGMRRHGFKYIFFIGDSGGNQDGQKRVAQKLSARWKDQGVTVASIDDYYARNYQASYLLHDGYTEQQIGTHAGMRDTSEMLYVHPAGVRTADEAVMMEPSGVIGMPEFARRGIGKKMIRLKVNAALKQIEEITGRKPLAEGAGQSVVQ